MEGVLEDIGRKGRKSEESKGVRMKKEECYSVTTPTNTTITTFHSVSLPSIPPPTEFSHWKFYYGLAKGVCTLQCHCVVYSQMLALSGM